MHNFKIINNILYVILCSECTVNVTSNELQFDVLSNIFSDIMKQRWYSFPGLELCCIYHSCIKYYILWSLNWSLLLDFSHDLMAACVWAAQVRGVGLAWTVGETNMLFLKTRVCVLTSVQSMILFHSMLYLIRTSMHWMLFYVLAWRYICHFQSYSVPLYGTVQVFRGELWVFQ
jgi:hypothetical protein